MRVLACQDVATEDAQEGVMSKMRIVVSVLVTVILVLVGSLVYALQAPATQPQTQGQTQAQRGRALQADPKFGCTCTTGGITAGMAILHCTCGNANCLAIRSNTSTGDVAVSCK